MFVHIGNKLVNSDFIEWVDFTNLVKSNYIRVYYVDGEAENVDGPEAFNLIIKICPAALEGEDAKYAKHAWSIHNLIGHPLMQICAWFHLTSLGLKIHDITMPNPKVSSGI